MIVVKYIVLFAVVILTFWLLIDTIVTIVKKVKVRKKKAQEKVQDNEQESNVDSKTE